MVSGNSVIFQIGKESTYGTAVAGTKQIKISSESFKPNYNKVDEGLATGGRGSGLKQTMGIKVEGALSTLMRPDMGYLLFAALGAQEVEEGSGSSYIHTFTCIQNGESYHLPAWTAYVDRKIGVFKYNGCKVSSMTLSAAAGDYLKLDMNFAGRTEASGASLASLSPSALKAFKFAQGKVYRKVSSDWVEIADITNMSLELNNNLDSDTQTTGTGDYYAEPEVGTRECNITLDMIYSTAAEQLRAAYYKSDDTLAVRLVFTSDELADDDPSVPYKLTIEVPCCQMSDSSANMSGLDKMVQNVTLNAVDNLTDEFVTMELVNLDSSAY